jgi:SNF2 family DNA or RNA helicase
MKTEDYLTLPERINRVVKVTLPPDVMRRYEQFEEEQILAIEGEEEDISAVNAAALSNKLLQFAGGAIYFDGGSEYYAVHRAKLEALKEHIESANGQPVLVFYNFRHEKERILRETKEYQPVCIEERGSIDAWNKGEIKVLLAHPASAGHGLNLQYGGHIIIWYGINWSLELYQQACARLHRMNQVKPVIVYHLVAVGTLDAEVMLSLEGKAKTQESLMQAIKARIKKYKK